MSDEPKYPNVRCDNHPDAPDEPGYIVCEHVLRGAAVRDFQPATSKSLGHVLCESCARHVSHLKSDSLVLGCAHLIRENGWDKMTLQ